MSNLRVKQHPTLGIWVREDGCLYLPQSGKNRAHWTFGSKQSRGYLQVKISGKRCLVHRLVVEAFIQYPIPDGCEIDHISRDKLANMVTNLRIVTPSANRRNTADHDRVTERGDTHYYEDEKKANREQANRYRQYKRKTHRQLSFSDGSRHWIPIEEAESLLKIPLNQRIFNK